MSTSHTLEHRFSRLRVGESNNREPPPKYLQLPYSWVYGVQIKTKDWHRISKDFNWPWEEDPMSCECAIMDWVIQETGILFKFRTVKYRDKTAEIVTFVIDNERRMDGSRYKQEQMDAVRRQFGISRPFRWFELYGRNSSADGENGDSSGDEEYPHVELPPGPELDDDDVEGFEADAESDAVLEPEEQQRR